MSKKHKEETTCFDCDHCVYTGEGDHLCDVNNEFVVEEWKPTDKFYHCGGKKFEVI